MPAAPCAAKRSVSAVKPEMSAKSVAQRNASAIGWSACVRARTRSITVRGMKRASVSTMGSLPVVALSTLIVPATRLPGPVFPRL
ncbi:hypothetical protein D3C83_117460 [compost metagenome]